MSTLKDNTIKYKTEIKNNFESFEPSSDGKIEIRQLNDFISSVNSKKKNPFIYNSIKSLSSQKQKDNKEGISSDEFISFIDKQLDDKSSEGLKNIYNVFSDSNTGNISWNTFPLIAKELGDNDIAEKLLNVLKQSKMYTKELNFKEFSDIMNNSEYDNYSYNNSNNSGMSEKNSNKRNNNDINIKDYMDNYEERQTYKERKLNKEQNKENKNYIEDNDDIIIEEINYDNNNENNDNIIEENNFDNEKNNKRYHRRYRSKKVPNNIENGDISNNNHKYYNKYRKKHPNC